VQFGEWNHAAGPDFLHAAVEIDGAKHTGPLELDPHAADWEAHRHAENPAFREVVLHVVFAAGRKAHFTRSSDGREIPCVVISPDLLDEALDHPLHARAASNMAISPMAISICVFIIGSVVSLTIISIFIIFSSSHFIISWAKTGVTVKRQTVAAVAYLSM
jgi:hypothetical protein